MRIVTLDLETVPSGREDLRAMVADSVKPPGTLKKPESIAKWIEEERPGAVAEAVQRMGLDGATAEIAVLGYAFGNEDPVTLHGASEREMLDEFFGRVGDYLCRDHYQVPTQQLLIVAHHAEFDVGMMRKRSIVTGVDRPLWFPFQFKPWEQNRVFCTMRAWDQDPGRRISLDKLCRVLGIPSPKNGIDGSKVWEFIQAGKVEEVAAYCRDDVSAARACFWRMFDGIIEGA